MKARMFCKTHGRLEIDQIIIKNGNPICSRCSSELQFGNVRPRFDVNSSKKKSKK